MTETSAAPATDIADQDPAPATDIAASATVPATGTGNEHRIPKGRLDEEIAKRRALEAEVSALADAMLQAIPENLHALIPEALSPVQRLKWFDQAKATGVFSNRPSVPETDNGRTKATLKETDSSTLPATARMASGYGRT